MKKILFALLLISITYFAEAQIKNPVKWSYNAKKIDAKNYVLEITANLDPQWHIYTLDHKGEIGVATSITFNNNPLGSLKGSLKTSQKPKKMTDPSTGEMVSFYEGSVVFTQAVTLKAPVKTTFTGTIEFMACDDKMCLPPKESTFSISLN